ncbi:DUF488 domain-containing protein [Halobaculum sp. CBA1158]|uniref:DUF488 family protein, N3 subclade n=1 Tax=Halobaculum sp. CBA1158 TaxID=2904243 RepID=UPI001F319EE3|nr:DUF488 family protein [Halobaculum sp. CBA1158]UIO99303.1 DUF488 domain-containing protein [Halobaculum sp. CBA1158]
MPLFDVHADALTRGRADLPEGTRLVGVAPPGASGVRGVVDERRPALAPPAELLADHADAAESFRIDGLCAAGAHNAAWDRVGVDDRYRAYLAGDADARAAVADLRSALADGDDVALVCVENTDKRRCHRTVLREVVAGDGAVDDAADALDSPGTAERDDARCD